MHPARKNGYRLSVLVLLDFLQTARAAGLAEAQLKYFENMIAVERKWLNARRQ